MLLLGTSPVKYEASPGDHIFRIIPYGCLRERRSVRLEFTVADDGTMVEPTISYYL